MTLDFTNKSKLRQQTFYFEQESIIYSCSKKKKWYIVRLTIAQPNERFFIKQFPRKYKSIS